MTKFCPFMSKNSSFHADETAQCAEQCALYWEGYCSINILAQKAIRDFKKEKKDKEESISE